MATNRIKQVHEFGQSIWLDFIDRPIMNTGKLQQMIDEDGLRGITSNPAIFEKAISSSEDYDDDIRELAGQHKSNEAIFYGLAVKDIQQAADLFAPVYDDKVDGADGFVSLEVSPRLARDTDGTLQQARELWKQVGRENVMIKIPGTAEGLPAVRQALANGININVTLLFSLERYEAVAEAYISGLEDRAAAGQPIDQIASVASFFLSRIDTLIDPMLAEKGLSDLKGEVAIASAKKAYEIYKQVFGSERFKKLEAKGATPQRLLWASTGTKDPSFSDVKYVDALIGPDTVDTVPMETLDAYRDHGNPANRLEDDLNKATETLERVRQAGLDLPALMQQLEDEGIDKFNKPYDKLLSAIDKQVQQLTEA
jgi:transaldolase/transaldolase/glucose-6-phosphate isomerase